MIAMLEAGFHLSSRNGLEDSKISLFMSCGFCFYFCSFPESLQIDYYYYLFGNLS